MTDELPRTLKSCNVTTFGGNDPDRNILIVPDKSRDRLTDKEFVDYHEYRKQFLIYLLKFGKDETKALGYSLYTVYADHHRSAMLDRWLWDRHDGYQVPRPKKTPRRSWRRLPCRTGPRQPRANCWRCSSGIRGGFSTSTAKTNGSSTGPSTVAGAVAANQRTSSR